LEDNTTKKKVRDIADSVYNKLRARGNKKTIRNYYINNVLRILVKLFMNYFLNTFPFTMSNYKYDESYDNGNFDQVKPQTEQFEICTLNKTITMEQLIRYSMIFVTMYLRNSSLCTLFSAFSDVDKFKIFDNIVMDIDYMKIAQEVINFSHKLTFHRNDELLKKIFPRQDTVQFGVMMEKVRDCMATRTMKNYDSNLFFLGKHLDLIFAPDVHTEKTLDDYNVQALLRIIYNSNLFKCGLKPCDVGKLGVVNIMQCKGVHYSRSLLNNLNNTVETSESTKHLPMKLKSTVSKLNILNTLLQSKVSYNKYRVRRTIQTINQKHIILPPRINSLVNLNAALPKNKEYIIEFTEHLLNMYNVCRDYGSHRDIDVVNFEKKCSDITFQPIGYSEIHNRLLVTKILEKGIHSKHPVDMYLATYIKENRSSLNYFFYKCLQKEKRFYTTVKSIFDVELGQNLIQYDKIMVEEILYRMYIRKNNVYQNIKKQYANEILNVLSVIFIKYFLDLRIHNEHLLKYKRMNFFNHNIHLADEHHINIKVHNEVIDISQLIVYLMCILINYMRSSIYGRIILKIEGVKVLTQLALDSFITYFIHNNVVHYLYQYTKNKQFNENSTLCKIKEGFTDMKEDQPLKINDPIEKDDCIRIATRSFIESNDLYLPLSYNVENPVCLFYNDANKEYINTITGFIYKRIFETNTAEHDVDDPPFIQLHFDLSQNDEHRIKKIVQQMLN